MLSECGDDEIDIITWWAEQELPEWKKSGKVSAPRTCLAKLREGKDINKVNEYLQKVLPWSGTGSDIKFIYKGDYDFTLTILTTILHQFGSDDTVLYPETRSWMLDHLMTLSGRRGSLKVPITCGLVEETENHILMMEGSRYLKNKWLKDHGSKEEVHDNQLNGLGSFLTSFIREKRENGLDEYNSKPYIGYTLTAVLNLHAFADGDVGSEATKLIDRLNEKYASSSLSFRRYPPFRRRLDHAREEELDQDYQTWMMKVWSSKNKKMMVKDGSHAKEHCLMAAVIPYDLPGEVQDILRREDEEYVLRIGHGKGRSSEIYSNGPGYLITAGGSRSRLFTIEVTRPITLILNDGAVVLRDVLHMGNIYHRCRGRNQTGVAKRFAVSRGPLNIPKGWIPQSTKGNWILFVRGKIAIITYSSRQMALFALFPGEDPEGLLKRVVMSNPDERGLKTAFVTPSGQEYSYDLESPMNRYMMRSIDGRPFDRDIHDWSYWDRALE